MLAVFIIISLIGYLINISIPSRNEKALYGTSLATLTLNLIYFIGFFFQWADNHFHAIFEHGFKVYEAGDSHFGVEFYFDANTAVYFLVATILSFLVNIFSRYYLHRERGFKRFFNNVTLFYLGLSLILFAGNFETLFIGWEIIGITSFFLIGFYRDRYLPVKNALKVVSIYRIADVFLLIGIWFCHQHFHESVSFEELNKWLAEGKDIIADEPYKTLIPFIFLVIALVKSAQFPFSAWLPRAMEGPTTSSAIFYGSLSVHIGVFVLIRIYPIWANDLLFKLIVIVLGAITALLATFTARVQSAIKTQIAYSSISQIGIMFIEVAIGWHTLALIHFASNAFLRTYQLLVSPSVLSYMIHDQFYSFETPKTTQQSSLWGRITMAIYVLSIKEWNLDSFMYGYLWQPLKKLGNLLGFITPKSLGFVFAPLYAIGLYFAYHEYYFSETTCHVIAFLAALIGLLLILKAFSERDLAKYSWLYIIGNQFFIALAIAFNEHFNYQDVHIYLSGIVISALLGYYCLNRLEINGEPTLLNRFQGLSYVHPRLASVFLVACLGLAGFPITPTFIGEDLLLGHIHENQFILSSLIALSLIIGGLAIFRVYSRIFLGPHEVGWHEVAYRSS
jgi:NADH-quinone oxidoreductase subunit L